MEAPPWTEEELAVWEQASAQLLRGLGLCPIHKGERLVCLLVAMTAAWPDQLARGLEPLYAEAARRSGGTADSIERLLRRELTRLWRQGDRRLLGGWFPRLKGGRCPGSGAFLMVLARKVREGRPRL